MSEADWLQFLSQASDREFQAVGQLSPELTAHVQAETSLVQIERRYVIKLIDKHSVSLAMLTLMSSAIDHGYAYSDKERHLTFLFEDRESTRDKVKLLLKVTRNRRQILVCTFFKLRSSEFRRLLKKAESFGILRSHK